MFVQIYLKRMILKVLKIPFVRLENCKRPRAPKIFIPTQSLPTAATRTVYHEICKGMVKIC